MQDAIYLVSAVRVKARNVTSWNCMHIDVPTAISTRTVRRIIWEMRLVIYGLKIALYIGICNDTLNFGGIKHFFIKNIDVPCSKLVHNVYSKRCTTINRHVFYITNEIQLIQCSLLLPALYMFRVVFPPIIRSL